MNKMKPSVRKTFKRGKQKKKLQELQTAAYEEVDLKHPIKYNGHGICGLAKRGMLKSFVGKKKFHPKVDLYRKVSFQNIKRAFSVSYL